jgi:hypothetical protein
MHSQIGDEATNNISAVRDISSTNYPINRKSNFNETNETLGVNRQPSDQESFRVSSASSFQTSRFNSFQCHQAKR